MLGAETYFKAAELESSSDWRRKPLKTDNSLALELYLASSFYFLQVELWNNDSVMH